MGGLVAPADIRRKKKSPVFSPVWVCRTPEELGVGRIFGFVLGSAKSCRNLSRRTQRKNQGGRCQPESRADYGLPEACAEQAGRGTSPRPQGNHQGEGEGAASDVIAVGQRNRVNDHGYRGCYPDQ